VVVLCGCQVVYGVDHVDPVPPDAPPACPAFGSAPAFSSVIDEVQGDHCMQYTESPSAGFAMAVCFDAPANRYEVATGPLGGPFTFVPSLRYGSNDISQARLFADGSAALLLVFNSSSFALVRFRNDNGTWAFDSAPAIPAAAIQQISAVTVDHHVLVMRSDQLDEIDVDSAAVLQSYTTADLGGYVSLSRATSIGITPDGARMVFMGVLAGSPPQVMYADRAPGAARFGPLMEISGVPTQVTDPYMTEDCSRIYYSSNFIGALFTAKEQL
jgi:hypothetical protein